AEFSDRGAVDQHRPLSRRINSGFAPALTGGKVDVEQMHLVVAGADPPFAIDDEAAVGALSVLHQHRKRADVEPDTVALRRLAARSEDRVLFLAPDVLCGAPAVAI